MESNHHRRLRRPTPCPLGHREERKRSRRAHRPHGEHNGVGQRRKRKMEPRAGIEPAPPAWKAGVIAGRPPGLAKDRGDLGFEPNVRTPGVKTGIAALEWHPGLASIQRMIALTGRRLTNLATRVERNRRPGDPRSVTSRPLGCHPRSFPAYVRRTKKRWRGRLGLNQRIAALPRRCLSAWPRPRAKNNDCRAPGHSGLGTMALALEPSTAPIVSGCDTTQRSASAAGLPSAGSPATGGGGGTRTHGHLLVGQWL